MNFNLIAYGIYLTITFLIIFKVGKICYTNGNTFVLQLIPNHEALCLQINKALLLGYYLLNMGYCAMTLISWKKITTLSALIEVITSKTALIMLLIAIMHYINIILLTKYIKKLT